MAKSDEINHVSYSCQVQLIDGQRPSLVALEIIGRYEAAVFFSDKIAKSQHRFICYSLTPLHPTSTAPRVDRNVCLCSGQIMISNKTMFLQENSIKILSSVAKIHVLNQINIFIQNTVRHFFHAVK